MSKLVAVRLWGNWHVTLHVGVCEYVTRHQLHQIPQLTICVIFKHGAYACVIK